MVAAAICVPVAGVPVVTAVLLDERLTDNPPDEAAALKVTLQASVPGPVIEALLQESEVKAAVPLDLWDVASALEKAPVFSAFAGLAPTQHDRARGRQKNAMVERPLCHGLCGEV